MKLLALAAALALSGLAQAQTTPRADVKAEAASAVKAGTVGNATAEGRTGKPMKADASTQPRADVKADAAKATKEGKTGATEGRTDPKMATKSDSGKPRAEVKTEAAAATKDGKTAPTEGRTEAPKK
jgi:hypothetical protein